MVKLTNMFVLQAKLPRGIENIRPHLEKVDNVPLLVPLFTDVTHASKLSVEREGKKGVSPCNI